MKTFWCIHEDLLKTPIKFINENFLMYSQRFIEDPDKVYKWKLSDVFTKIHWRSWISWWIKNVWCIHEDLLKILIKFMNEKFLMYSRRFIKNYLQKQISERNCTFRFFNCSWDIYLPWNCPSIVCTKVFVFSETVHEK